MQGTAWGELFRRAAAKVGATCREDNFDTSAIQVRAATMWQHMQHTTRCSLRRPTAACRPLHWLQLCPRPAQLSGPQPDKLLSCVQLLAADVDRFLRELVAQGAAASLQRGSRAA